MKKERLVELFEKNNFIVHLFDEDGIQCAEIKKHTDFGVDMIIRLCPFSEEEFFHYVSNFNITEQIDFHRKDQSYRESFPDISTCLCDFKEYEKMLQYVAYQIGQKSSPKHLYIRLKVQDGMREHTHHCLTTTKCESPEFAVNWYAAHFWGHGVMYRDHAKEVYYMFDSELAVEVQTWKVLTPMEFRTLNDIIV